MHLKKIFLQPFVYIFMLGSLFLFFSRCEKDMNGNVISLTVKHNGKAVDHGNTTIKGDSGYEKKVEIDVYGKVWVSDLKPGNYTVHAEVYDQLTKQNLIGNLSVKLISGGRSDEYKIDL